MINENSRIYINSYEDLKWLVSSIRENKRFATNVIFSDDLLDTFFIEMNISKDDFYTNRYYYDSEHNIHISFCIEEDIETIGLWISTFGFACYKSNEFISSNYVNALYSQSIVISLFVKEARELLNIKETYDTSGYYYGELRYLSQAFYHNWIFFYELIGKCYLSLCNVKFTYTHKLDKILKLVRQTMFEKKHNDSLFHLLIVYELQNVVNHINILPSDFREEFVKYNDNQKDNTLIVFNKELLDEIVRIVNIAKYIAIICDNESDGFFKQGLYEKMIRQSTDEEDRIKREIFYKFLIEVPS